MSINVLHIGKFFPVRGGVERVMFDIAIGLLDTDIECDILCVDNLDPSCDIKKNKDYSKLQNRLILCKKNKEIARTMLSLDMISKLKKICKKYDILHIHHPDPMAALALFMSGFKGKVVLHWHSDILKQKYLLKLYKPLQKWLINRADIILGTTPKYIEESPYLQSCQDKTDYLLIGADEVVFDKQKVEDIKNKYAGKKIVFSLGRLVEYKGFEFLIEAARKFDDNTILLIGGDGYLKDKLNELIEGNNLSDKVKMLGLLSDSDKLAYIGACDVFCISSILKTEAYAIVQVEAMSCGKPVISTDIPGSGVPWVNKHGVSGIVVQPKSSEDIYNAINSLTKDVSLYEKLSQGAKKRYNDLFRKEYMIKNIYDIYRKLS